MIDNKDIYNKDIDNKDTATSSHSTTTEETTSRLMGSRVFASTKAMPRAYMPWLVLKRPVHGSLKMDNKYVVVLNRLCTTTTVTVISSRS